uniref:SAM domain-containing protein n=1 Tax=Oncorhynchus tshawytscha TaxID=74940 RepID=A0A8C8GWX5_ONCTS
HTHTHAQSTSVEAVEAPPSSNPDVMDETKTQIAWPSKLKIGAKSKKDPHIKVCGKRDNVREAKDRIMSVLDTKSNRVTLKMDVSHTEHSHVIGKGGNNIKKVMEDTGCHIHFPDSNRNNQAEKSNQVSIAGQPGGVEAARSKIRELLPLVLSFELPAIVQPDPGSPTVQHISQTYNLTVSFKPPTRLYGTTGVVRGSQNNSSAVKRGTAILLEHLAGSLASAISVSTHLDIAPQHHLFMMGRNGSNIKHITQRTGAQIHFPDPNSPQKKSTVYIQGIIESVCVARQYLMGCLPLVLMFDIKEDIEVEPQYITALMEQLDVFISIKPKPKQPSKSVIVKSVERNAVNMYEARKFLLGLESNGVSSALSPSTIGPSPTLICPVGLDILASAGLGLSSLGNGVLFTSALEYEQKKLLATKGKCQSFEQFLSSLKGYCVNFFQTFLVTGFICVLCPAMLKKPVVTEVRTPTNTWSGLGFSKSMPAETIKELRRANHVSYKPTMSTTYEVNSDYEVNTNGALNSAEHYLSSSNYMDCISSVTGSNGCSLQSSLKGSDLPELFSKLGLGKYTDVFQQQEIDLQTFLTLTDQDLKELGITTFGARRKMLLAISELNKNRRKLFEPPIRSSFLEGGASGRLSRQFHADMASVSGRW